MANTHDGAFVEFDRVQKSYDGETLVVKDLNLSIGRGEFLTMLGPSGSGKTTCLMMLAGFETATHGDIRLAGRPINSVPPHKRGIGMVFQNYALFPHMTVGENLAFPLEVRGMGKDEREAKIKRALDMVQMGAFASRRPAPASRSAVSGSSKIRASASAMSFASGVSVKRAAGSPSDVTSTSRSTGRPFATTGRPEIAASTAASPKVSDFEGKA